MFCPDCGYKNKENATFCFACGSILRKILGEGRYEIIKFLNRGGMEQLFLARDTKMKTDIVIKQLTPPKDQDKLSFEYLKNRMKEEARFLYRLNYRGLPRVMDFFPDQGSFFLTMQFIDGEDLEQVISRQPEGRVDIEQCIQWMDRLLDITSFLHNQVPPIIHRDIKPRNIMIDSDKELYLIDFGIACIMEEGKDYTRVGTFEYASPEHFAGVIDTRSDIYSLGATIYYLLTGLSPSERAHPGSFPPLKQYLPDAPDKLAEILAKMTIFCKEERYGNCDEIRQELREDPQIAKYLQIDEPTEGLPSGSLPPAAESPKKTDETDGNGKVRDKEEDQLKTGDMESDEITSKKTSKKTQNWTPALFVVLPLLLIGLAIVFFHYRGRLTHLSRKTTQEYKIVSVSSNRKKILKLKVLANKENLPFRLTVKESYKTKGTTCRVLAQFDSRTLTVHGLTLLKEKKYRAILKENPQDGITVRLIETFGNMQEAEKKAKEINRVYEINSFFAKAVPRRVPGILYELEIDGIHSRKKALQLKDKFAPYSDKLEIIPIENKKSR
ncbi:MAG: protein kinase [Candidatus Eremiobacteraeota bacterium]|nr:protein kinase [Candidatus Eremiobacteraeota bacterium]